MLHRSLQAQNFHTDFLLASWGTDMNNTLAGDESKRDPPEPIPNSEVKPFRADGTAGATRWESRSSPAALLNDKPFSFC